MIDACEELFERGLITLFALEALRIEPVVCDGRDTETNERRRFSLPASAVGLAGQLGDLPVAQIGAEVAQQDVAEAVDRPVSLQQQPVA